jgi:hypothetical protein
MNSSWEKTTSGVLRVAAIVTGMISLASRPESRAALAFRCDRNANASISSRVNPYRSATFWAVSIIPMYALRASSAGLGGPPAPAHMVSSMKTGPLGLKAASPFISAHPERDIDSTPHAMPTPRSPALMAWLTLIVALSDDPQKRLIVAPATLSGNPAASAAHRPTSPIPSWAGFTHPATTSSMAPGSTPTRSQAPFIVIPRRSSVRMCDNELP